MRPSASIGDAYATLLPVPAAVTPDAAPPLRTAWSIWIRVFTTQIGLPKVAAAIPAPRPPTKFARASATPRDSAASFAYLYTVKYTARTGPIPNTVVPRPRYSPRMPSSRKTLRRRTSTRADSTKPTRAPDAPATPPPACNRVLTTSSGHVTTAAMQPPTAPATNGVRRNLGGSPTPGDAINVTASVQLRTIGSASHQPDKSLLGRRRVTKGENTLQQQRKTRDATRRDAVALI
mmetsp:Transcript_18444/g.65301  ORF Transcript_18444/g.65301 Transcript_18444/m.65301 type:complete len:234 (-) Transcript_18444:6-707(-)